MFKEDRDEGPVKTKDENKKGQEKRQRSGPQSGPKGNGRSWREDRPMAVVK
jgi:hypothetical protein